MEFSDELIGYIETGGRCLIQESAVTQRFVLKVKRPDIERRILEHLKEPDLH